MKEEKKWHQFIPLVFTSTLLFFAGQVYFSHFDEYNEITKSDFTYYLKWSLIQALFLTIGFFFFHRRDVKKAQSKEKKQ
jgi:uncharacterized membrane protein SirB2